MLAGDFGVEAFVADFGISGLRVGLGDCVASSVIGLVVGFVATFGISGLRAGFGEGCAVVVVGVVLLVVCLGVSGLR